MTLGCVADAVHTVHDGIHGSVITDGGICAIEVVVDSARQSYTAHIVFPRKLHGTSERTISPYHHQSVDAMLLHIVIGFLSAFRCLEFLAPSCLENSSTRHDDTTYVLSGKGLNFVVNQAIIPAEDAHDFEAIAYSGTSDGPDGRIHSRSIATRSQDSYRFNPCHII